MTLFAYLADSTLVRALGCALLHFIWQGSIVALLLASALGIVPTRASRLRYAIACAAMAFMAFLPFITCFVLDADSQLQSKEYAITIAAKSVSRMFSSRFEQYPGLLTVRFESVVDQALPAVICFLVYWRSAITVSPGLCP